MPDNICGLPKSVTLELTEVCNLHCKMCYFWGDTGCFSNAETGRKPAVMELEMVQRIARELAPAKPNYSLFGGEPLTYPHLEEMILAIKKGASLVDSPTNGTLLEKHAKLLVETEFDSVRVSIDGTQEVNDLQRGKGAFDKAMAGIEAVHREKQKAGKQKPIIGIIYTVTPENHLSIEKFFLHDLNLSAVVWVTIQMQNFITDKMGLAYSNLLKTKFDISSDRYWRGMVRSPQDFAQMDAVELARQVNEVKKRLGELGKFVMLLPRVFSPENLAAYLKADWAGMTEKYKRCVVPWHAVDITATGDIAPCHVFFDLVMGNLQQQSFEEIWNGDKYRSFRAHMEQHGLMPICPGCCILYIAGSVS